MLQGHSIGLWREAPSDSREALGMDRPPGRLLAGSLVASSVEAFVLASASMAEVQRLAASPVRWDVQIELRGNPGFRRLPPIEQARMFEEVYSEAYDARNGTIQGAIYETLSVAVAVLSCGHALVFLTLWRRSSP